MLRLSPGALKSMKPQLGMTTKGADTARNDEWSELSDLCAQHTSQIVGEVIYPRRTLTTGDLDDIFAGRPLSERPDSGRR